MKKIYYGLVKKSHLLDTALAVCSVIGKPNDNGLEMVIETCASETLLGTLKDPTEYSAGSSVAQIDCTTFKWLRSEYSKSTTSDKIKAAFDIDISRVQYSELEHSPLCAIIFCRLRYLIVPHKIPSNITGRAKYWKKWYNSTAGKGTVDGYLKKCAQCDVESLLALVK